MTASEDVQVLNTDVQASIRSRSPRPGRDSPPVNLQYGPSSAAAETIELEAVPSKGSAAKDSVAVSPVAISVASRSVSRRKAHLQMISLCFCLFVAGWNDGSTGPLLPRIQQVYHVGFAVVSLIFVFNCIGFVTAAAANVALTDQLGFGVVMVIGAVAQIIAFAIESPAPPFPVLVLGYAINGFGVALQDAGANGYIASLKDNSPTKMGILHAVYGLGALIAPLIATQFAHLHHWSYHYLTSLGVAIVDLILLVVIFRFKGQDECLAEIGQEPSEHSSANQDNKYKQIFRLRALHLLAVFIFVYVGVEVTIGGWIVTYVMDERGGGPSSGYISSGFFGGLTLGRIGLLWLNKKIGERRAIFVYVVGVIGLELIVWLVPSLIGGAIAVSFVGVLLGPVYPIAMNHSGRVLPPWLLTGCIGWIAGFGQAGSAFLPFLTGLISAREGIKALQPFLVSMMSLMLVMWALVPNSPRRVD